MRKILLFILLPLKLLAQDLSTITHDNTSPVDDYANVFTSTQKQELTRVIAKFFDTVQISVVTIPSFNGIDPSHATVDLFNRWGIGSKANNGLLLVIGINDHKMFACTGRGIQGLSPSSKIFRAEQDKLTDNDNNVWIIFFVVLAVCGVIVSIVVYFIKKAKREEQERNDAVSKRLAAIQTGYNTDSLSRRRPHAGSSSPVYVPPATTDYSSSTGYSSGYDSSSSSSSSSADSSSSSSFDFGGGSSDGGGGGSSW